MQLNPTDLPISTFELLAKPIAPRNQLPVAQRPVARRIIQGYFLTITNLESIELTYRLEFRISTPNPVDPDRTLFNNVDLLIDIAGANTFIPLSGNAGSTTFGGSFRLPAGQTASVQLLPRLSLLIPDPDFEVRGYVVLRLPALGRGIFQFGPQTEKPVSVLLSPEIRGTFIPNDFPASATGDFDQINYALPIASGKALNALAPEPPFFLINPAIRERLGTLNTLAEQPSMTELLAMSEMVAVRPTPEDSPETAAVAGSLLD
jgi:hypothetical protein